VIQLYLSLQHKIAQIEDYKALAMEMFIVKSATDGATARSLNTRDYKAFDMNGSKVGINQLEMIDISSLDSRVDEIYADMQVMKEEDGLHTMVAFKCKLENNQVWLDGVLSRKKQVVPFLQPLF